MVSTYSLPVGSLSLLLGWGGQCCLQAPDVHPDICYWNFLQSSAGCGRWLTCSNQTSPFISPPKAGSPVPQNQDERHLSPERILPV